MKKSRGNLIVIETNKSLDYNLFKFNSSKVKYFVNPTWKDQNQKEKLAHKN